jgi:tetratricopeptide (TPR) repeat protein
MSDSPSTRPVRASDPPDDADREARIEQLLLTGLDHYFAGQYDRAINVWTRVVFLERHHDRARAYIERARGALAERHRKSEEYLHDGVAAYNAGDVQKARDLLTRALEQGSEGAHVFLGRLDRITPVSPGADARSRQVPEDGSGRSLRVPAAAPGGGWGTAALSAVLVAAAMLVSGLPLGSWLSQSQAVDPIPVARPAAPEPLLVVRPSEVALQRARSLRADGRLRDALRTLDDFRLASGSGEEVDELRADIQGDLFTAAGISEPFPVVAGGRP